MCDAEWLRSGFSWETVPRCYDPNACKSWAAFSWHHKVTSWYVTLTRAPDDKSIFKVSIPSEMQTDHLPNIGDRRYRCSQLTQWTNKESTRNIKTWCLFSQTQINLFLHVTYYDSLLHIVSYLVIECLQSENLGNLKPPSSDTISHFVSVSLNLLIYGRKTSDTLTTLCSLFYVVKSTFKIRDEKSLLSRIYFADAALNIHNIPFTSQNNPTTVFMIQVKSHRFEITVK